MNYTRLLLRVATVILDRVGNGGCSGCETVSREVLPQVEIPEKWTQGPPCFAITIGVRLRSHTNQGWTRSVVTHAIVLHRSVMNKICSYIPDSKVHGANMGPIWGRQDPGGPHVGPMNLAIRDDIALTRYPGQWLTRFFATHDKALPWSAMNKTCSCTCHSNAWIKDDQRCVLGSHYTSLWWPKPCGCIQSSYVTMSQLTYFW